jgi:Replication factor RFC1 C terminal domain
MFSVMILSILISPYSISLHAFSVLKVVTLLDAYGLSRDDMMETMREMQFTIEKDTSMCDYFDKLDSQVKVCTYPYSITGVEAEHKHKHNHQHRCQHQHLLL